MQQPAKEAKEEVATESASTGRTHWSRQAARLSVASAFACFTLSCVVNQLLLKNPQPGREWVWNVTDFLAMGLIGVGIVAGLAGFYGGIRKKSGDTIGIALLGLFLHLGILFVAFWLRAALKEQAG